MRISGRKLKGRKVLRGAGIAESDADVPQEGVAFDALDGRFGEKGPEVVFGE
jgi:hypothetical protein